VGTKKEGYLKGTGPRHLERRASAVAWREPDVQRAHAARRGVQDRIPVPAVLDGTQRDRELCGKRRDGCSVGPRQRALTDEDQRALGLLERLGESMAAGGKIA